MTRARQLDLQGDADAIDFLELMNRHGPRLFAALMRHLPSDPRCRLCHVPYGGTGGRIMRRFGFEPSRKNPTMCNTCFEKAPMGGALLEVGVLFADVRGFVAQTEGMPADKVAAWMNRFYSCATDILSRSAIIDKLVGDEVMALYLSPLLRERWENEMLRDAADLLAAVGYGSGEEPWLRLGIGLDVGNAFVGNVGSGEVKDFTALGEVVNTTSRLQASAEAGQIVLSERLCARLSARPAGARAVTLDLKGLSDPFRACVLDLGAANRSAAAAL